VHGGKRPIVAWAYPPALEPGVCGGDRARGANSHHSDGRVIIWRHSVDREQLAALCCRTTSLGRCQWPAITGNSLVVAGECPRHQRLQYGLLRARLRLDLRERTRLATCVLWPRFPPPSISTHGLTAANARHINGGSNHLLGENGSGGALFELRGQSLL